jgi:hypothetical protein
VRLRTRSPPDILEGLGDEPDDERIAAPDGFQLLVGTAETHSAWKWLNAKKALAFARLTNDGDCEGAFILPALPTAEQAIAIRAQLGIPKARHLPEELRIKGALRLQKALSLRRVSGPQTAVPISTDPMEPIEGELAFFGE